MKMITGYLAPSAGTIKVCGFGVADAPIAVKASMGYLPEGAPAYPDMTPLAFLRFIARVRGLSGAAAGKAVDRAVERTDILAVIDQPIDTLSKGFKRRVGIAQAILHDPPVLIMDEPTDGLDPNQKFEVRRLIQEMAPNKTIIISTHILEEVEAICTRALIIDRGKVVADGTPEDLLRRAPDHLAILVDVAKADQVRAQSALQTFAGLRLEDAHGLSRLVVPRGDGPPPVAEVAEALRAAGIAPHALKVDQGRLDDVFRRLTRPEAGTSKAH
jgi:ABC-2 type transport system ATP-binding protein